MGRRRGHKSGNDLIGDGMKYASMFGVAHEGFKAWANHNSNNNGQQTQREPSPAPPMMQQSPCQQPPMQYQQQYLQHPMQFQQTSIQHRGQVVQREEIATPPPYSEQPETSSTHLAWCNGQCGAQCSQDSKTTRNPENATMHYSGDESVKC